MRGFRGQLRGLSAAINREVSQRMFAAGSLIATEAQISLTTGAVSGKNHVPSKPGEAPNQDTAVLGNNIEVRQPEPLRVEIASTAPYSAPLELGTSKMAARPFMAPAANKKRRDVNKLLSGAARKAIRRHLAR